MAGYSGTPLAQKLGIRSGTQVCPLNAPARYTDFLEPLPANVQFVKKANANTNVIHIFSVRSDELRQSLKELRSIVAPDAAVWVSWPKKSSKVATDITEDVIRDVALPLGFVDIKVCAVSDVWSGLKLVVRKALR